MGRFLTRLNETAHRIIGLSDGSAFEIRRVRSADLVAFGMAEIVGAADVAAALADIKQEQRTALVGDDEEAKAKQAAIESRNSAAAMQAIQKEILKSPERIQAFAGRIDGYVCAAVVAAGEWTPPEWETLEDEKAEAEAAGKRSKGWDITADDCAYMEPVRFCMAEDGQDHDADRVWVVLLAETTRQAIAAAAMELTSSRAAVRPFRREPGDVPAVASNGPRLRGAS